MFASFGVPLSKALIALAGSTQMQHKFHAERRAEFINWARTTFEDEKAAQKNDPPGGNEPDGQITYHDASVCPVMNKSSPAISEFSLDQCSFLADWFHRYLFAQDTQFCHRRSCRQLLSVSVECDITYWLYRSL